MVKTLCLTDIVTFVLLFCSLGNWWQQNPFDSLRTRTHAYQHAGSVLYHYAHCACHVVLLWGTYRHHTRYGC